MLGLEAAGELLVQVPSFCGASLVVMSVTHCVGESLITAQFAENFSTAASVGLRESGDSTGV